MHTSRLFSILSLSLFAIAQAEESTFQQGLNDYLGTRDVTLLGAPEEARVQNYSGDEQIRVAGVPGGGFQMLGLIRFDNLVGESPGQVPRNARINSAELHLFKVSQPLDSGQYDNKVDQRLEINLFQMLRSFASGPADDPSVAEYATYSFRSTGGDLDEFWGDKNSIEEGPVQEIDFLSHHIATIPLEPENEEKWFTVDITSTVTQWVEDPTSNHGIYLRAYGFHIGAYFASSNFNDPELRPKLVIDWSH